MSDKNLARTLKLCGLFNRITSLVNDGIPDYSHPEYSHPEAWYWIKSMMFERSSSSYCLLFEIKEIFLQIDLSNLRQQMYISKYFVWLRDDFIPFLGVAKNFIPNVHVRVDNYLKATNAPPLHQMLSMMTTRFRHEPMRFFCSMLLCKNSPRAIGLVIAQFNGNAYLGSEMIATKLGLTPGQLKLQLFNLRNLPRIEGKSFWRKIRVISIILNFLIKMLVPELWFFQTIIRNRVLRRLGN